MNTQYINLNMVPSGVLPVLYCSQYDIGRPLGMVVYNGSESLDLSTYSCTIEATRSDGTAITAAVTTDGSIGAFSTTATMTNVADKYPAKLILSDNQSHRVASLAFILCVTPATMDENAEGVEEDASLYRQYTVTVQTLISAIRTQLTAETAARQAADSAEASARQTADNTLQNNINAEASTRAIADASLQSQIDQLVSPSGSAPSAAEVENARIGTDGTVYPILGDAIRTQNTALNSAIFRMLKGYTFDYSSVTASHFGINSVGQWTSDQDQKSYTFPIDADTVAIVVTANAAGSAIAFLNTYNPVATEIADFSTPYPARITLQANESREFIIRDNMNYMYALLQNQSGGDRTPVVTISRIKTDATLTEEFIPADAKAVGDIVFTNSNDIAALKEHAFMLRTGYATTIADYTDYDTLTTPGNYRVTTGASAATMVNCPTGSPHRLEILTTTATNRLYQMLFANNADYPSVFMRFYDGSWSRWARFLNTGNSKAYSAYIDTEASRVANRVRNWQTGTSLTFVAVSDMHYNADNRVVQDALSDMANAVKAVANQTHIDFYASFGDEIWRLSSDGNFAKGKTEMIAMTKLLNECFSNNTQIRMVGNHDPNAEGSSGYFTADQLNAFVGIYSNFIERFETFPAGGIGYHDFERQKIRLIALNTSLYEQGTAPTQGSTQYTFGVRQAYWLCQMLDMSDKSDADDWQIVLMSHVNLDVTEHANTIGKYSDVLAAYENGSTWASGDYTYNFSGKNIAKLALCINGHWHQYRVKNMRHVDSSGNVLATLSAANLFVPNALPDRDYESMDGVTYTKTADSATSTAFLIITIDQDKGVICAHHYGAGIDIILHYLPDAVSSAKTYTTVLSSPVWNVNDTTIATVSNGVVTPVSDGNTMVWCKSEADGYIEAWNISVNI